MLKRLVSIGIFLCCLAYPMTGGAQVAPPRPARTTTAQPTAAAPPQVPAFQTIQQVCQFRERELIRLNQQLVGRNQAAAAERDAGKKQQILAPMQGLMANLRETEASWNRMDCARLLYGAR